MRRFDINETDIRSIVKKFDIGDFISYSIEEGIRHQHSNKIVSVRTTAGDFILKFYLYTIPRYVILEYLIVKNLIDIGFPTPRMYLGKKPPILFREYPAAMFDLISGTTLSNRKISTKDMRSVLSLIDEVKDKL